MDIQKYWQYVPDEIVTIDGKLDILSDGYMLDLESHGINKSLLPQFKRVAKNYSMVEEQLKEVNVKLVKISSGWSRYLGRCLYVDNFVVVGGKGREIRVQHKYVAYFEQVYKGCEFYATPTRNELVAIKNDGKIVGAVMPILDGTIYIPAEQVVAGGSL